MKLYKPKFWKSKNLISLSLIPLSLITQLIIFFKKLFTKVQNFKIPVICVGNIYIGGTGKTPLCISIAKELLVKGRNPAIIRKYYKSHKDEHELIKRNFANLVLNSNRYNAILDAENEKFDSVILDDGYQDYKIKKNLNILCFNSNQLVGNGFIIPAGPLRESLDAIKKAQIIVINGERNSLFEKKILGINKDLDIFYSSYNPVNVEKFKEKKLLAIAGIGNPENFFELLGKHNLNVVKKYIFPDHYIFNKNEVEKLIGEAKKNNYQIVLTEKDYYKFKEFKNKKVDFLKVELIIKEKEKLIKKINNIYN